MNGISSPELDVVIIGAGFGGLYALHALREKGFAVHALEAGAGVGGTWFWNRYPGARCDVESLSYQYSFSRQLIDEWTWSERYATQPEILAYAEFVADRLDLRRDISFSAQVVEARFDEERSVWRVRVADGRELVARFLLTAVGSLSAASVPPFEGAGTFAGDMLHPGRWPAEGYDFAGKRVAVVGVGSSGVQLFPEIARQAEQATLFQRTPAYTIPARNRPLYEDEIVHARRNHEELRTLARQTTSGTNLAASGLRIRDAAPAARKAMLDRAWHLGGNLFVSTFADTSSDLEANGLLADYVRAKINTIVSDPAVAEKLTPRSYPIGAKRIITDTNFYASFNRPNVRLVSLAEDPIVRIVPEGIVTASGLHAADVIVFATGYDSLTGALTRIDIFGRDGERLRDSWASGAHTYLGIAVAGFPNLFTITGPQSPSVLANMFAAIEQHVEWVVDCLVHLRERGLRTIEADRDAERGWDAEVEAAVRPTLYLHAQSWYRGSNIAGKPSQFLVYCGGLSRYRGICDDVANDGYRGFSAA